MYEDSRDWRVPEWFYEEHEKFCVHGESSGWRHPSQDLARKLLIAVNNAKNEHDLQKFLEEHPLIWLCFMRTGHGNWAFPQVRLGGMFVPDFLIAEGSSRGLFWRMIELESPNAKPYKKDGNFSHSLRTAINQIADWRQYIADQQQLITSPKSSGGTGLHQFKGRCFGTIYIGRRHDKYPARYNIRRQCLRDEQHIEVCSYDTFVEQVQASLTRFER